MKEMQSYRLNDIFELAESEKIELPTVQRGFVWRPYQIENFWDSLLRGYPVGAFVFAKNSAKLNLLDGQQRATSIYLAFCGRSDSNKNSSFKTTTNNIQIFIDLGKPDLGDNRKYIFRVITKSHPWGYRRTANQKTLEAYKINAALTRYNIVNGNYLETPLKNFWPYDAINPVPFSFFLHGNSLRQIETMIKEWQENTGHNGQTTGGCGLFTLEEIWRDAQRMLNELQIPALYLDIDSVILNSIEKHTPDRCRSDDESPGLEKNLALAEDRNTDEIENLFIRLNSGGTPLRGEELNYSILKANIHIDLQRKLEASCSGMFSPARLVTLAFRLFQQSKEGTDKSNTLSMRIKAKQFQTAIRSSNNGFTKYLQKIVDGDKIDQLRKLLSYSPQENKFGLPQFLYTSLAEKAPEVMFILLYRLWIVGDRFKYGDGLYRRMLGVITMFVWLGRGGSRRDHSRLLNNISSKLSERDPEKFWTNSLISAARKVDPQTNTPVLIMPMPLRTLERLIPQKSPKTYADVDTFAFINEEYAPFIYNTLYNRDMLLYAQREAIHLWFSDMDYSLLEDSDLPYDWDHIFPQKWIKKNGIKNELRQWYNTIGNLRAWPYSLNRGDKANRLNEKLAIENETIFREDLCRSAGLNADNIAFSKKILCDWSACDNTWMNITYDKMNTEDNAKKTIKLIRARAISVYKDWYESLNISKLIFHNPIQDR